MAFASVALQPTGRAVHVPAPFGGLLSRAARRGADIGRRRNVQSVRSDRSALAARGRAVFLGQPLRMWSTSPQFPPAAAPQSARCSSESNDAGESAPESKKSYYWRQGYNTPSLILYTKSGCCLCEALLDKILDLYADSLGLGKLDFVLDVRDIEMKPEWFEKYQYEIPVLVKAFPQPSPRLSTAQLHAFLEKYFEVLQPSPEPEFQLEEYVSPIEAELIAKSAKPAEPEA
eukprot:tig00021348_g20545.t1